MAAVDKKINLVKIILQNVMVLGRPKKHPLKKLQHFELKENCN
jgi:hypothetical protein